MKKDKYEILQKNIQRVELVSLTGQTWLDSFGNLVPWSGSNHSGSVYIGPNVNDIVDNITGSVNKGYYKWAGITWIKITGSTDNEISGSVYGSYQLPLYLESSVDEMGVMVGLEDGDLGIEQIEQLINFNYTQTGSFIKIYSTTDPEKLRSIIDQQYEISWGHNNVTSSLEINKGVSGTNFPTASYTYPTTSGSYTISMSLNTPWSRDKIKKTITVPQFIGSPENISGSITVNVPYNDSIETLNYLNNLDYTDNYGPVTISGSIFKYSAFGKSKINEFKKYGGGINSSSFTYGTIDDSQFTGYTFTYTGSFISGTSYNMVTLSYRDFDDGFTTITGTTTGFTREEVFNEALTRNEHFLGFIDEPVIFSDIFVERGKQGVLEKTHRLGEIDTVGELDIYGNGYFKVRKQ